MKMGVDLGSGTAQPSGHGFHLPGVFLPSFVMLKELFLHFSTISPFPSPLIQEAL